MARSFGCGKEPPGSIEGWEFIGFLSDCDLVKNDTAPWSQMIGIIFRIKYMETKL